MKTVYPIGPRFSRSRLLVSFLFSIASLTLISASPDSQSSASINPSMDVGAESIQDPHQFDNVEAEVVVAPSLDEVVSAVSSAATLESASFVELGALDSNPDEHFNDFLVRVSQAMDVFTGATGHEACGVIMVSESEDAWRVRLTTNRSHVGCTMVSFDELGFSRLGQDIHSHPRVPGGVYANAQDIERRPDFKCGARVFIFDETFSKIDLARGPGYLVTRNQLLYQQGADKPFRQLAVFESLSETPVLSLDAVLSSDDQDPVASAAAAAAWANEDLEGIPSTRCGATQGSAPPKP